MKIMDGLQQGDDAWLAIRRDYFCSSEAAAMMGFDSKTSRSELLRMKATGAAKEFSEWAQKNLLDKGHEIEALVRPLAEEHIGDELFPVTGTLEVEGLPLLASFDGQSMVGDIIWECKSRNAELLKALSLDDLPDSHWPQVEHQLLVSGAEKALFSCGDGTREGTTHFPYESVPERRAKLIAGWKQFREDLAAYQHVETKPEPIVAPIEDLPALTVELIGEVKRSNLVTFKASVMARIQAINMDLKTDEDFAVADKTVKFLDDGEKRLELVKSQALAQTTSIDELFRTIDGLKAEMRAKRLTLDKLVKSRKESIREEIRREGVDAFALHVAALNKRLGKPYLPQIAADFTGVMKGKKTLTSLRDAVSTELARAKIESNAIADHIQANLKVLDELAGNHKALFPDVAQIVLKAQDDLVAAIKTRIAEHEAAEARKQEAIREKIRAEEKAKAEAEARAKLEAERKAQEQAERERIAAEQKATTQELPATTGQSNSRIREASEQTNAPSEVRPTAQQPVIVAPKPKVSAKTLRPSDEDMIGVLAAHYRVPDIRVVEWLLEIDFTKYGMRTVA